MNYGQDMLLTTDCELQNHGTYEYQCKCEVLKKFSDSVSEI